MGLFSSRISRLNNNSLNDNESFIGEFSWESWKLKSGWSDKDSEDYIYDELSLEELKAKLKNPSINFLFFIAEWCGDSHSAAPIVINLLENCGIDDPRINLIGVSRDKMSPDIAFRYNIDSIPTLLVLYDEYEIGRIEEYPAVSWEYDILKIVSEF